MTKIERQDDACQSASENKEAASVDTHQAVSRQDADKSFERLLRRYEGMIRKAAASFSVPTNVEREDLYQEGVIALYRAMCSYDESIASFSTFASVCIRRAMLTWIRDHVSKTDSEGNLITEIPIEEAFSGGELSYGRTPEQVYISKEELSVLKRNALKCLSDYEKCVFLMYLDNMTVSEISEALGKSRKSVENALSRIRIKVTQASV